MLAGHPLQHPLQSTTEQDEVEPGPAKVPQSHGYSCPPDPPASRSRTHWSYAALATMPMSWHLDAAVRPVDRALDVTFFRTHGPDTAGGMKNSSASPPTPVISLLDHSRAIEAKILAHERELSPAFCQRSVGSTLAYAAPQPLLRTIRSTAAANVSISSSVV